MVQMITEIRIRLELATATDLCALIVCKRSLSIAGTPIVFVSRFDVSGRVARPASVPTSPLPLHCHDLFAPEEMTCHAVGGPPLAGC